MNIIIVESDLTTTERITKTNCQKTFGNFSIRQPDSSTFGKWQYDFKHPDTFIGSAEANRRVWEKGWELGKLEHLLSLDKEFLYKQKDPIIALGTSYYRSGFLNYYPDYFVSPTISFKTEEYCLYEGTWVEVYSDYGRILLVRKVL